MSICVIYLFDKGEKCSQMGSTVFIFLLVAIFVVDGETETCTSTTTTGTHFMIAVPESDDIPDKIVLHITSVNSTTVTVRAPAVSFKETYKTINHVQVNLPLSIMHRSTGASSLSEKGIEIKSKNPCSITVLTHDSNDAAEGFLAYPVNALSTNYVISSYEPYGSSSSEFLLVGVKNQTNVTLYKKRAGYSRVDVSSITINEFSTYLFKSTHDLSDSVIASDKSIAVFSASGSSQIPEGYGDYQYLVEQMIPVKFWPKQYIIPAFYPMEYYMYRIYNSENNTIVRQYYGNTTDKDVVVTLGHKSNVVSNPAVVMADKPISVIQYGYDSNQMNGDPFMTTAQAISQFQNSYEFVTDFGKMGSIRWDVTLAVTVPTSEIPNILLDGNNANIQQYGHRMSVPLPFDNYSVVYINMTSSSSGTFHTLLHELGKPFGATLYSLPGSAAAYGYPLKFALKDKACQILTTTTTTTTTTPTTTVAQTTMTTTTTVAQTTMTTTTMPKPKAITTTPPSTTVRSVTTRQTSMASSYSNTGRRQCFNCRDIPHLKYCDRVTTCMEHEVCYVESYTKPHGEKLYRSGCIEKERCVPLSGQNDCLQCCDSSDFCNMDGCEEANSSLSRGPYCYDCSHLGEKEVCHSVQICPSDEVCMVEKYAWGDTDFSYVMGCIRPHVCEAKKRSLVDRKLNVRHVPVCTHCCASDFCNRNCTHHDSPSIIG